MISYKLLVNAPGGAQEIIEVEASGSYFDASRVLWDERLHGPLDLDGLALGGIVATGETRIAQVPVSHQELVAGPDVQVTRPKIEFVDGVPTEVGEETVMEPGPQEWQTITTMEDREVPVLANDEQLQAQHASAALEAAKVAAWEAIKAHRDRLSEVGGYSVTVGGTAKWFHSDVKSRTQQIGLVMLGANIPADTLWKTMDGSFVTMTQALAGQVFAAAAQQDMAIFAKAEQHKAAMLASADPASYDFSGGWPQVFAA